MNNMKCDAHNTTQTSTATTLCLPSLLRTISCVTWRLHPNPCNKHRPCAASSMHLANLSCTCPCVNYCSYTHFSSPGRPAVCVMHQCTHPEHQPHIAAKPLLKALNKAHHMSMTLRHDVWAPQLVWDLQMQLYNEGLRMVSTHVVLCLTCP